MRSDPSFVISDLPMDMFSRYVLGMLWYVIPINCLGNMHYIYYNLREVICDLHMYHWSTVVIMTCLWLRCG